MPVILEPASVIIADLGLEAGGPVHEFFTHTCRNHMDRFVPYSGDNQNRDHLREEVTETVDSIIYELPYAHAQYVGYTTGPVEHYTTPGTCAYWDEKMWTVDEREIMREVKRYMILHGGK